MSYNHDKEIENYQITNSILPYIKRSLDYSELYVCLKTKAESMESLQIEKEFNEYIKFYKDICNDDGSGLKFRFINGFFR
jgi:hypothetical protein